MSVKQSFEITTRRSLRQGAAALGPGGRTSKHSPVHLLPKARRKRLMFLRVGFQAMSEHEWG